MMKIVNIDITAQNANELDEFVPVTGTWQINDYGRDGGEDPADISDVEQSIRNWMDASYELDVKIFHADGREMNGEAQSEGTFVCVRK